MTDCLRARFVYVLSQFTFKLSRQALDQEEAFMRPLQVALYRDCCFNLHKQHLSLCPPSCPVKPMLLPLKNCHSLTK